MTCLRLCVMPFLISCTVDVGDADSPETLSTVVTTGYGETDTTTDPVTVVQSDVFVQTVYSAVDVLWVIDNSCSMAGEQMSLTGNFHLFLDYLLGLGIDYHVGVVSTDIDDPSQEGKLQTGGTGYLYIDSDTVDALGVFSDMAELGTAGSPLASGLGATYLSLETHRDTFNAGFYREDAALHTIVLSDGADQTDPSIVTETDFVSWYDGLKPDVDDDRAFSTLVDTALGTTYVSVSQQIGGVVWNVGGPGWAVVLDTLGFEVTGLEREFFLSQIPVADTIEVRVEDPAGVVFTFVEAVGDPPVGDYTYDPSENSITFLVFVPGAESMVHIKYDVLSAAAP